MSRIQLPTSKTEILKKRSRKIDYDKAVELRFLKGMTNKEVAQYFGVAEGTMSIALKPWTELMQDMLHGDVEIYRKHKGSFLELAEHVLLRQILDPAKLAKASVNNLAYAFAQIFNAGRLTRGESTENISMAQLNMSLSDIKKEKERIKGQLKDLGHHWP